MARCAIVSFRLGLTDGVSIVAESWQRALTAFGFDVVTVAGDGPVDRVVDGLALDADRSPSNAEVEHVLADADLVIVENLCTIPLNLPAARVVARTLQWRRAVLHHHDPAWQRAEYADVTELPPTDPAWLHVTINRLTQLQFEERGMQAQLIYNGFDADPPLGRRDDTRRAIGVADDERLLLHPVRAIRRKNVPGALRLAEQIGATYWLLGPAEDGYEDELDAALSGARCRVIHSPADIHDAYAACDAVAFPSTWEGFGNPPIEAALHRKPVAVGHYPVAEELRAAFGFAWFDPDDAAELSEFLTTPDERLLDHDQRVAQNNFSFERMASELHALLDDAGWLP